MKNSACSRDLLIARNLLEEKSANLVVVRDGNALFIGYGKGLSDLAKIVLNSPSILENSSIADRVVGKAAAVIFAVNGVKAVYSPLMSIRGYEVLIRHGVKTSYQILIDYVKSPEGGICPFEQLILDIDELHEAYGVLIRRFREMFGGL